MKYYYLLFSLGLFIALSACSGDDKLQDDLSIESNDSVNELVIVDSINTDLIETTDIDTTVILDSLSWKTESDYSHFESADLDTVYIGPNREIENPFEYFEEQRSNVFVMIDSGRYINDSGIWLQGENVIIKGQNGVSLLIDVLYDNVMWVVGNNIVIDNLHMMHLMPGELEGQNCSGRVIGFDNADNVTIVNCDLNGCGLAGLHDNVGNGTIYIEHNYIHNNSLGAYTDISGGVWQKEVPDHDVFVFKNNRMEDNGAEYGEYPDSNEEDFHGEH